MKASRLIAGHFMQPLTGMRFMDLFRVLARNNFRVSPSRVPHLAGLVTASCYNSAFSPYEKRLNRPKVEKRRIEHPPVFILGHFRSGTTHLQNLMFLDDNLYTPNYFQTSFPHIYLYCQRLGAPVLNRLLPPTRPMDNLALSAFRPNEDEFALAALCLSSPYFKFMFPVSGDEPHSLLDPLALPAKDLEKYKNALSVYVRKLTFTKGRRVLLKSPPHMARIRILLELYPQARFVHLFRNPYDVYLSTVNLWRKTISGIHLQEPRPDRVQEIILSWYKEMHALFERDRNLIPPGHLVEVRYEDLEKKPLACLERIYRGLDLPGFQALEKKATQYLEGIKDYRKNRFVLVAQARDKVAQEWGPWFEKYGYPR